MTGTAMHSEELRIRLWNEMLSAHMREFYYAKLAVRKRRLARIFAYAAAIASSATVVAAVEQFDWLNVHPIVPGVVAALSGIVVGTERFERAAIDLGNHSVAWSDLYHKLYRTWIDFEDWRVTHDDVCDILDRCHDQERILDRQVVTQPDDDDLALHCFNMAEDLARAT